MPIKIPEDLPARPILEGENIFVMTEGRANRQDIRPLEIAIVNLMPTKIATETQLLRLLGNTPLQVNVTLLRAEGHESKNTAPQHLERFYKTFSQVRDSSFDGMIITGAPVEQLAFEEVDYWDELVGIMDYAKKHVHANLPAVDQRVLVYRKLAAAEDLESIDEVQEETEAAHGELPLAGLNLFNRARIRIRGERLGLESVTLSGGRITFLGVDVPKKVAFELKTRYGAVNFPKSRKLSVPYKAGAGAGSGLGRGLDANDGTGPVAAALMLLQQLGASDDD